MKTFEEIQEIFEDYSLQTRPASLFPKSNLSTNDEAEIAYELLQENENQKNAELSHQKAHLEEITDKLRLASQELGELNKVVLFSQPYDFNELKKEIQRLKVENLEFQLERKKNQLEKLIVIS